MSVRVALTQYMALLAAGIVALVAQGPVASAVLGEAGAETTLPAGLTIGMLLLLGVFGVLGFLLYGVLYAAAGSLVSRQEDVQAAVMPLALVSTAAYLVAIYSATGLLDISDGWMAVLAVLPFISPFLILSQVSAGVASAPRSSWRSRCSSSPSAARSGSRPASTPPACCSTVSGRRSAGSGGWHVPGCNRSTST